MESFLRNPQPVLEQLHTRLESQAQGSEQVRKQLGRLERLLAQKTIERSRGVSLYRRGRLTDAELDAQLDEIGKEEAALAAQITELSGKISGADSIAANISSAEALLANLRKRLDEPVSCEQKRRLIEVLVAGIRVDTTETCGVKQNEITVTYRFSQPDQITAVVLPQSYSPEKVIRIPAEPRTIGDHIRKRRLGLKMLQREVAEQLGACEPSVFNWEANTSSPDIGYMPAIIQFLGYNPLPAAKTIAEELARHRVSLGLSQKAAAGRVGVDPGTLAKWERREQEPTGGFLERVKRLLEDEQENAPA